PAVRRCRGRWWCGSWVGPLLIDATGPYARRRGWPNGPVRDLVKRPAGPDLAGGAPAGWRPRHVGRRRCRAVPAGQREEWSVMARRVLVIGCGNMGASHARAYHRNSGYELVGLVAPTPTRRAALAAELGGVAEFDDVAEAISETRPDVVSVNSYPDTHHAYVTHALQAGCHVFCEKPLAETVENAQELADLAAQQDRVVLVGHILRV